MQRIDERLILSASDLVNYSECPHLSATDLHVAHGLQVIDETRSDTTDLVTGKGNEHEAAYLRSLKAQGVRLVEISAAERGLPGLHAAATATRAAMLSGADVVYQAALVDGDWRGFADFLERVDRPSPVLGDFSYEVLDTKLARHTKAYFLIQLCFYSELLEQLQGVRPEHMHVVLGSGERVSYRVDEFFAYYRRLKARYGQQLLADFAGTFPEPVAHCGLCRWSDHCDAQRIAVDHLSLVAGMTRSQSVRLGEAQITTVAALGGATPDARPKRIDSPTFERLRAQARLQVEERTTGRQEYELLAPEDGRGFALLPEPRTGDLFFDMEGDPFYEDGLEYLFGVTRIEHGEPVFRAFWAHDRAEEKRAFEDFIDFVMTALAHDPDLHVYHYAAYEQTALKALMGRHGTREAEVDELLTRGVLVDLYQVTRQALRISKSSYSIKKVEAFYMPAREEPVTDGGDSIVWFEEWLTCGDQTLLDQIEAYNKVDCLSTVKLHEWLLERRAEARHSFGAEIAWRKRQDGDEITPEQQEVLDEAARLELALTAGRPDDLKDPDEDGRARRLMAHLLHYHRREDKPVWWAYFARRDMSADELVEDSEAIGHLTFDASVPLEIVKRSYVYTLRFREQEHKLKPGDEILDPATGKGVNVVEIDDAAGVLKLCRGIASHDLPLPLALMPGGPYRTLEQRAALRRMATQIAEHGVGGPGRFHALRDLLTGAGPRVTGLSAGSSLLAGSPHIDELRRLVGGLDESCLFIQGPPGSGKTWTGAQLIVHLLGRKKRVGVTATSHKAIHNLLLEVEAAAVEHGVDFAGLKKCSSGKPESRFVSKRADPFIDNMSDGKCFPPPDDIGLVAGTAWLFSPETMDETVDFLFIDEAGQLSLADALAVGTAARNVVLLGDPLQLAQVSQGVHPGQAGCSVLEHLLGDHGTIPPERGVFLDHTRRMHPDVCRFVSEVVYENRLGAISECARQRVDAPGALTGC